MNWIWPFRKSLKLQLFGPQGELLRSVEKETYGAESFEGGVNLSWRWRHFDISLTCEATVFENNREILRKVEGPATQLSWKLPPQDLRIEFPNRCALKIQSEELKTFFPKILRQTTGVASLAILVQVLAVLLAVMGAKDALQMAQDRRAQSLLPSSIVVETKILQSEQEGKNKSQAKAALTREQRMRSLMQAWGGPGKPVASADEILKKEKKRPTGFGRNLDLDKDAEAWRSLSGDEDFATSGKDLNISDAVISQAFVPITPRLKECYDDVLIRDRSLEGKPEIWVDINLAGRVEGVAIENLRAKKAESLTQFQACILKAYSQVRLPQPNQVFSVKYTLILQQAKAQL